MPRPPLRDLLLGAAVALSLLSPGLARGGTAADGPHYDAAGRLLLPADYREWVFLSSGLDMSYSPQAAMAGAHMFNNVFVPKPAYAAFLKSGHWPDKTVLVLENRGGVTNRSILKHGEVQTGEIMGLEVHVRDTARFKGGWGFFSFDGKGPAPRIAYDKSCYSCHEAHGAVDSTFVQFYPTLLPVAQSLQTLSAAYLKDIAAEK